MNNSSEANQLAQHCPKLLWKQFKQQFTASYTANWAKKHMAAAVSIHTGGQFLHTAPLDKHQKKTCRCIERQVNAGYLVELWLLTFTQFPSTRKKEGSKEISTEA